MSERGQRYSTYAERIDEGDERRREETDGGVGVDSDPADWGLTLGAPWLLNDE